MLHAPSCGSHIKECLLTPTHLAMVLDFEAGGSVAEFVAQQVRDAESVKQGWGTQQRCGAAWRHLAPPDTGTLARGRAGYSACRSAGGSPLLNMVRPCSGMRSTSCLAPLGLQIPKVSRMDLVVDEGAPAALRLSVAGGAFEEHSVCCRDLPLVWVHHCGASQLQLTCSMPLLVLPCRADYARFMFKQLITGLEHLHDNHVAHR